MIKFVPTVKYEVVVGYQSGYDLFDAFTYEPTSSNGLFADWGRYANEYYEKTGVYVSAISGDSRAIYNSAWGCPKYGETTVTFNCTANPAFIKDMDLYEKGILYITGKLKKQYNQHTITITKLDSHICYLTDEENEELGNILEEE